MLFDDSELIVFKNNGSKKMFEEILESYQVKNYRSVIVSLYSLVIYDLYQKLIDMDEDGNKAARNVLNEIKTMISKNEPYSDIEKKIVNFFAEDYYDYFVKLKDDVNYLATLRHKCAHLYVNDEELFVPTQSQAKMLIEIMYNKLFKISAPFIDDLFRIAKADIEYYSEKKELYNKPKSIRLKLEKKYFNKMTDNSIVKSLNTLFRLSVKSNDENVKKHINGIYILLDSLLYYCQRVGKMDLLDLTKFEYFINGELDYDLMVKEQRAILIKIGNDYSKIMSIYKKNTTLINKIENHLLEKASRFIMCNNYFNEADMFEFFLNDKIIHISDHEYEELLYFYEDKYNFSYDDFFVKSFSSIDTYNSYSTADAISELFMKKIDCVSIGAIENILEIYNSNRQCYGRGAHENFRIALTEYIDTKNIDIDFNKYKKIFF